MFFLIRGKLKVVIDNYPEGKEEICEADNHPKKPEMGKRSMPFSRELWIEREDFQIAPPKGYFRLYPGNEVRLRYAYVVKCTGFEKDADGNVLSPQERADETTFMTRYRTFVAETQKIAGLYTDLAKQTFKPYEGLVSKFTPAAH